MDHMCPFCAPVKAFKTNGLLEHHIEDEHQEELFERKKEKLQDKS